MTTQRLTSVYRLFFVALERDGHGGESRSVGLDILAYARWTVASGLRPARTSLRATKRGFKLARPD